MDRVTIDYDTQSDVLSSSKPTTLKPRSYSPNDVFRVSSGNGQCSVSSRRSELAKVKVEDACCAASTRRRRPSHQAQTALKLQQRKKKRSSVKDDDWGGFRPAELLSPRYINYRKKQHQKSKEGTAGVWPDFLEHAFQLGMSAQDGSAHL